MKVVFVHLDLGIGRSNDVVECSEPMKGNKVHLCSSQDLQKTEQYL